MNIARNLIVTALVAVLMAGFVLVYRLLVPAQAQPMTQMTPAPMADGMTGAPQRGTMAPQVKGYTEGQEIRFLHTEASDLNVAQMLTIMMGSPVLVVPSLAQAPDAMLANVYVFTDGVRGEGPFGFQPDVFDNPPGTEGYRPLRAVNLVRWNDERAARELKSAIEVREAQAKGEITIERPERPPIVVNMPMVTWPGGQR